MLSNLIKNIQSCELQDTPFAHIKINNIFTDEYYEEIVKNFPTKQAPYLQKLSSTYYNRFVLDLDDVGGNPIHQVDNQYKQGLDFWFDFKEKILSEDLMYCFLEKYKDFVPKKYWGNAYPTARLSIDLPPYSIGGHRDRGDKLVSVMLYTPSKNYDVDIQDNYGTALLKLKDPNFKVTDQHYDLDLFDKVDNAPYVRNSLFSWAVVKNSYHGVYPLEYEVPRPTIGYFIKNMTNTARRL